MEAIFGDYIWQCAIAATVSGLIGYLGGVIKDKKREVEEHKKAQEQMIADLLETNKRLVEWKEKMDEDIKYLHETLDEMKGKIGCIREGNMALMRDRIIQSCRYFIDKGYITIVAKSNIIAMHDSYKAHGGNGICDSYFTRMMELNMDEEPSDMVPNMHLAHHTITNKDAEDENH